MSYYLITRINIKDWEEYQQYVAQEGKESDVFELEILAADRRPLLLERAWKYSHNVLMKFASKENFEKWYYSPDYQVMLKYR